MKSRALASSLLGAVGWTALAALAGCGADDSIGELTKPDGGGSSRTDASVRVDGAAAAAAVEVPSYAVRGTVTGLTGEGLVLLNAGGDAIDVTADGPFAFPTKVKRGVTFSVGIKTQPTGPAQVCNVIGGSGTVVAGDVTTIAVNCTTSSFTIGGTVAGLAGTGLVLENNGGSPIDVNANGAFAFPTPLEDGATYAVTVKADPAGPAQACTVEHGSGTLAGADVTDVKVACTTKRFAVGGTVSGLGAGSIVLTNHGAEVTLDANGPFTFPTTAIEGAPYNVAIKAQPADFRCTLANARGFVGTKDVTDVAVTCLPRSCKGVRLGNPAATSGAYDISPISKQYKVYCDMTSGGAWTLVMKGNRASNAFAFASPHWTTDSEVSPTSTNLDAVDAKFRAFGELPAAEISIGTVNDKGAGKIVVPNPTRTTLLARFQEPSRRLTPSLGRRAWLASQAGVELQPNCNRDGFNLSGLYVKARIGLEANQENDCNTSDSVVGIGIDANSCGNTASSWSAGFYSGKDCPGPVVPSVKGRGADFYLWVR